MREKSIKDLSREKETLPRLRCSADYGVKCLGFVRYAKS